MKPILTICAEQGCGAWVVKGRCEQHKHSKMRDKEAIKEYGTTAWKQARDRYKRANPLCVTCKAQGIYTAAYAVDHVVSVANGAAFWDESNWQSLCRSCHNRKTRNELNYRRS